MPTVEELFSLWSASPAGAAALAEAAAAKRAADEARIAEQMAKTAEWEARRREEMERLTPAAREFDAFSATLGINRARAEEVLRPAGGWFLAHLNRAAETEITQMHYDNFAGSPDANLLALRRKAAHVATVRRYAVYYRYLASLDGEKLATAKRAANKIGPQTGIGVVQNIGGAEFLRGAVHTLPADEHAALCGSCWPVLAS